VSDQRIRAALSARNGIRLPKQLQERDDVGLVLFGQDHRRIAVERRVRGDREKLHVVPYHVLERRCQVVVEVRRGFVNGPERRNLERVGALTSQPGRCPPQSVARNLRADARSGSELCQSIPPIPFISTGFALDKTLVVKTASRTS